ncbi:shikimate kinase, partial [Ruminococcus callidus]
LEGKVLQSIYTNQAVISTGGSAVYSDDAMQYLKSTGIVIYLHHQLDVLAQRVGNLVTRGVVCHSGCTTLEDLYEERCPLYEKYADLTVDFTGCSVEQCSEKLLKTVQAYLKEHPNC